MLAGTFVSVRCLKRTSIIILPETTLDFISLSTVLLKTRVSSSETEAIGIRADVCTVEVWARLDAPSRSTVSAGALGKFSLMEVEYT